MKKYLFLLFAAAGLVACNSKDEASEWTNDDAAVALKISGKVAMSMHATRAHDAAWSAGDQIGVFVLEKNSANVINEMSNLAYVTEAGDGQFAAVEGEAMIPTRNKNSYDVAAYYPYAALAEGKVNVYLGNQESPEAIDLMSARVSGVNRDNTSAELSFAHKLSKVSLTVKTEGPSLDNLAVRMGNQIVDAAYNPTTDQVAPATADRTNITFHNGEVENGTVLVEAIVLPNMEGNEAADRQLQFELNGELFTAKIEAATAFEAGKKYLYEVTFTASNEAVLIGAGIKDWEDGDGSQGSTILKPVDATFGQVYVMGSMNGWSQTEMTLEEEGIFTWTGNIQSGDELKFTLEPNGNYNTYQLMAPENGKNVEEGTAMEVRLVYYMVNGVDNKWKFAEGGKYTVRLDLTDTNSMKLTCTRLGDVAIEQLYIVGDATPAGWDMSKAPKFTLTDETNRIFTLTTILYSGEFKMPLRNDRGYGCDFIMPVNNGDAFVADGSVMQGKLHKDGDEGDDKWVVSAEQTEKTYTLTFDAVNLTLTAVEVTE